MDEYDTKLLIDAQLRDKYGDDSKGWLKMWLAISLIANAAMAVTIYQTHQLIIQFTGG